MEVCIIFVMDRIRFTNRELELIELCVGNHIDKVENFTLGEKQKLIDAVSDYFIRYGFKKNDEPNQLGLELEQLIDKLNMF